MENNIAITRTPKLLTRQEAAAYLGVSLPTLAEIQREPGFPIVRMGARRVFVNREKLDKWIDERTQWVEVDTEDV